MPSPGAIIFFDWEHDGTCDHVGIVERCDGTTVYTIEGNSGDAVKERSYAISSNSSMPSPGAIIFFDWEHDGTCDHVGIVERCDGTTVYTIEGNSGDAVKERSYAISSNSIMGYGMVDY